MQERAVELHVEIQRVGRHERQERQQNQRERQVEARQNHEHAHERHQRDKQVLGAVVREFANVVEVTRDAAHQLPGAVSVVEPEGQLLQVREQVAAHVALDKRAHHVALIVQKAVGGDLHGQQAHHQPAHTQQFGPRLLRRQGQHRAGDVPGTQRIDQRDARHQQGAQQVSVQGQAVGPVIACEVAQRRRKFGFGLQS